MKKSVNVYQTSGLTMIVKNSKKYWHIEVISYNFRLYRSYRVEKKFEGNPRFASESELISSFTQLGVMAGTKTCFETVKDFNIKIKTL